MQAIAPTSTRKRGNSWPLPRDLTRLSKTDGDLTRKSSTSFNRDDLPLVAKGADMAHTDLFGLGQSEDAT
jgi:hypothetical protein